MKIIQYRVTLAIVSEVDIVLILFVPVLSPAIVSDFSYPCSSLLLDSDYDRCFRSVPEAFATSNA